MYQLDQIQIELPEPVRQILNTLTDAGFEAYVVGGCVRDAVLGRTPGDWDITTSALPEQVKSLFFHTVDTGIEHGTVMVLKAGAGYEVTTYRIDGEYQDGRHPEQVTFTASLEEDLKRRDFTINAFAYHPKTGVVDLFDGIGDLNRGLIRCVGNPDERFSEDALRIMRAVRFAAQLSFSVEEETKAAIQRHAANLRKISAERIRVEFEKTLLSANPDMVLLYAEYGMASGIVGQQELAEKCFDLYGAELCKAICTQNENFRFLRLAAFLHHLTGKEATRLLRTLRYDNRTIHAVSAILNNRDTEPAADKIKIRKALHQMGEETFFAVLDFQEAQEDVSETESGGLNCVASMKRETLRQTRKLAKEIVANHEPYQIRDLAVNGTDLLEAGIAQGDAIGTALNALLEKVMEDPSCNTKETLLKFLM